ncbi:TPA: hypothetical protein ACF2DD_002013 [Clostridium perfringens]
MAMNLKKLIKNEKEIKSIVYVDGGNNTTVEYDKFDVIRNNYEDYIIIYKPDLKQKEIIRKYLSEYMTKKGDEENSSKLYDDKEFLYTLFKELTDVFTDEFNIENEEDLKIWNTIVENPSDLFVNANQELTQIANEILMIFIKDIQEFNKIPKGLKKDVLKNMEEIQKQNKLKQEEAKLKKERDLAKKEYEDMVKKMKEYEEKFGAIGE